MGIRRQVRFVFGHIQQHASCIWQITAMQGSCAAQWHGRHPALCMAWIDETTGAAMAHPSTLLHTNTAHMPRQSIHGWLLVEPQVHPQERHNLNRGLQSGYDPDHCLCRRFFSLYQPFLLAPARAALQPGASAALLAAQAQRLGLTEGLPWEVCIAHNAWCYVPLRIYHHLCRRRHACTPTYQAYVVDYMMRY